jgi:hypothetical protein
MRSVCCVFLAAAMTLVGCGPASKPKDKSKRVNSTPVTTESDAAGQEAQRYRLEWNRNMFVGDYDRCGSHSPTWDAAARIALENYARFRAGELGQRDVLKASLIESVKAAEATGCEDPLIKYLYVHFVLAEEKSAAPDQVKQFRSIAEALMRDPQRSVIGKYYAAIRGVEAAEAGSATHELGASEPGSAVNIKELQLRSSRKSENLNWQSKARNFLLDLTSDKKTPPDEVYDAWELLFSLTDEHSSDRYVPYLQAQKTIFTNWPSVASLYLQKGCFYTAHAWRARGSGLADSVTPKGWLDFSNRLVIAEQALNKAWELDPTDSRIAREMITVELGQGRGRDRMELWFNRAMNLNPNDLDACRAKLYYLEPKWYGSLKDMFLFASECIRSEKWGGEVPLIMVSAHERAAKYLDESQQARYWKQPGVWKSIKEAYEKFSRLSPQDFHWRNSYALYAYRAEQWSELNRQLATLDKVDYQVFGGKPAFDKIVATARKHATEAGG